MTSHPAECHPRSFRGVKPFRGGFTLMEVLLALLLASLVMMVLGMAISVHLRVTEAGRSRVE